MVTTSARALSFNIVYDSNLSAFGSQLADLKAATSYAAKEYSALYSNNVTLNIKIQADPRIGLGGSYFEDIDTNGFTYSQVRSALIAGASSAASVSATKYLSLSDPTHGGYFDVPNAQAKALGLTSADNSELDGTFFIGTSRGLTFDPNNRAVTGKYDYIGTVEHEFSEIMGRISQMTPTGAVYLPMDLFRFTAPGVQTINATATGVYFSTDNGATNLRGYNDPGNRGDIQDWARGPLSNAYDAFARIGEASAIDSVDQALMNVLGWRTFGRTSGLTPAQTSGRTPGQISSQSSSLGVPEPAAWLLMVVGFGAVGSLARRRRTRMVCA